MWGAYFFSLVRPRDVYSGATHSAATPEDLGRQAGVSVCMCVYLCVRVCGGRESVFVCLCVAVISGGVFRE